MELAHSPGKVPRGPRACVTCARAKSRCIPGPVDEICERCHRLNKPCSSQVPAPPRKRKGPKPTRMVELGDELEQLTAQAAKSQVRPLSPSVSSLRPGSTAGMKMPPPGSDRHPFTRVFWSGLPPIFGADGVSVPNGGSTPDDSAAGPAISPGVSGVQASPESLGFSRAAFPGLGMPGPGCRPDATDSLWPRSSEAEILLGTYRKHFAHLFPFVIVPPYKTSDELRRERPYMWKAMVTQAYHMDGERQVVLGNDLLKDIAASAFTRPEKSLDLLQGLELLITWFNYNLHSFQMTNLLFLARSLCVSLGLTDPRSSRLMGGGLAPVRLEQMRAFCGCYYLVTSLFTTSKKPDEFMNPSHLEECCRFLETKMGSPTDLLVVYLVRIQHLAQSISTALAPRNTSLPTELPVIFIVKSFRGQLDAFRDSLPESLRDNPSLLSHIHVAEMLLFEIGTLEPQQAFYLTPMDRLGLLWSCLDAAKSFLEIRSKNDPIDNPLFVCINSFDSVYALIICLKLITLNVPGWDLNIVRSKLGLDKFVERQAADLQAIAKMRRGNRPGGGPQDSSQEDPFVRLARKLDMLKESVAVELESIYRPPVPALQEQQQPSLAEATHDIVQDLDGWVWQDLFYGNDLDGSDWLTQTIWGM